MIDMSDARSIFSGIYRGNVWGDRQSASAPGSNLRQTEILLRELPALLAGLGVKTLVDAPCGDMNWMRRLDYAFICADIAWDPLPKADALLCRDALVHLPHAMIRAFVANLKRSGIPLLLTTTFPEKVNKDIEIGQWRALNLEDPPLDWPPPLHVIRERPPDPGDPYNDKSLAVWRVSDIPVRG
ncbi:MAG: class I SAM-dependent methyltransferase [Alphaproteobacteria bacterium]|nr:class I SAM-dependent methyltransferase [Alphaproteobacteria bacterium]